ncbi:MAG: hypothetical protein WCA31_04470 [Acidimicrobiales bacterium]
MTTRDATVTRGLFGVRGGPAVVVVVVARVVLVERATAFFVATFDVVVDALDAGCNGVELDDAVNVNTRTNSKRGLDHITQCVLLSEWGRLMLVLAGYWSS